MSFSLTQKGQSDWSYVLSAYPVAFTSIGIKHMLWSWVLVGEQSASKRRRLSLYEIRRSKLEGSIGILVFFSFSNWRGKDRKAILENIKGIKNNIDIFFNFKNLLRERKRNKSFLPVILNQNKIKIYICIFFYCKVFVPFILPFRKPS